jgi:pyridoxal phosphate enzyme (YggS family)
MPDIALNIKVLKQQIPSSVDDIMVAYKTGHRFFGENRAQELLSKTDQLPSDIEWHLIGHLQSNKVKYIVPIVSTIQSVDSAKLLAKINSEAVKAGRTIGCLLQIHIAKEENKFGFNMREISQMLESDEFKSFGNVNVFGVMGMATFTDDMYIVRDEFKFLKSCFNSIKNNYFRKNEQFKEISMGMSGDFIEAIEEGSTIVRIGSLIFGERGTALS